MKERKQTLNRAYGFWVMIAIAVIPFSLFGQKKARGQRTARLFSMLQDRDI